MSNTLKTEVTEQGFYTFLDLSVLLTGFSKNELLATGMHETYYYTIMKEPDQDEVRGFFNRAQAILETHKGDEAALTAEIRTELFPDGRYQGLARRIIMLWYTGIWTKVEVTTTGIARTKDIVNAESFIQGLIWKAAETHPAGAKLPGYASWADPPL